MSKARIEAAAITLLVIGLLVIYHASPAIGNMVLPLVLVAAGLLGYADSMEQP